MTDNRPKTVPFCKDCKYHNAGAFVHYCHKVTPDIDIVSGSEFFPQCHAVRADPDKCGWSAKWHEPK